MNIMRSAELPAGQLAQGTLQQRVLHWARRHSGSLLCVALPTLLAGLYYFLIASDLYASEARFLVSSPSRGQVGGILGFLQGAEIDKAQTDVYAVHDYMLSRDAIAALQAKVDLRAIFSRPEADFIARFPGLLHSDTTEDFYRYYERRVSVVYDTTTGICTVTVKAFRPDDAKAVANQLLSEAEALVNRLNARARANAVHDSQVEVEQMEQRVAQAQQAMLDYRNRETLLDPGKTSGAIFDNQSKMMAELAAARIRLTELDRSAPGSPLRADLVTQIQALEKQAANESSRLTGGSSAMASKIREYEQLALRQEFATKELTAALASLETANEDARRQQIYLERVVEADLPDKALYPKRVISVLIVFVSCFLAYSIGLLLLTGVREHAQD